MAQARRRLRCAYCCLTVMVSLQLLSIRLLTCVEGAAQHNRANHTQHVYNPAKIAAKVQHLARSFFVPFRQRGITAEDMTYDSGLEHAVHLEMWTDLLVQRPPGCIIAQALKQTIWLDFEESSKHPWFWNDWERERFHYGMQLLHQFLEQGPTTDFEFMMCTHDCAELEQHGSPWWDRPIFTMVHCEQGSSIPFPEKYELRDLPIRQELVGYLAKPTPWDKRQSVAVFRGAFRPNSTFDENGTVTLGTPITQQNWKAIGRTRLMHLHSQRPDLINLNAQYYEHILPVHDDDFRLADYVDLPVHMNLSEQAQTFKYAIYAEGECGWADRLKYLHLYGFLVLRQETPCNAYYAYLFQPHVHYLPLDGNFNNLLETIEWARLHDQKARKIALDGRKLARALFSQDMVQAYASAVFRAYAELMSYTPTQRTRARQFNPNSSLVCNRTTDPVICDFEGTLF